MIDVDKVCREWERLGGVVRRDDEPADEFRTEYKWLCHKATGEVEDSLCAAVSDRSVSAYFEIGSANFIDLRATEDVLRQLPDLAAVWGLSPMLTWDEAAALWVEWGGVSCPETSGSFASLRLEARGSRPVRQGVVLNHGKAMWPHAQAGEFTLTADTLEDMAEACGLPRTPGRVEAIVKEEIARTRIKRLLTATSIDIDVNLGPKPPESLGEKMVRIVMAKPKTTPQPKAVDQHAEQTRAYNEALDDFMR